MSYSYFFKTFLAMLGLALAQLAFAADVAAPQPAAGQPAWLADTHAKAKVACASCHGSAKVEVGDTVENAACNKCHVGYAELAKKTVSKEAPNRNPHASHLGDVDCVVCHKGHEASAAYCNGCHQKFKMTIPGG